MDDQRRIVDEYPNDTVEYKTYNIFTSSRHLPTQFRQTIGIDWKSCYAEEKVKRFKCFKNSQGSYVERPVTVRTQLNTLLPVYTVTRNCKAPGLSYSVQVRASFRLIQRKWNKNVAKKTSNLATHKEPNRTLSDCRGARKLLILSSLQL